MKPALTTRIAELMLAGESGTVKHWATLLKHPSNNLSSILRGMVARGAAQITATGRGRNGSVYGAGDVAQLEGRVNGTVRRGTRPERADVDTGTTADVTGDEPAVTTEHLCQFFISTDWSIQVIDPQRPDEPIYLTQREWREDLLPFLKRLDAALDPV